MTPASMPSVSVIIPVYNNAAYIGEAVESVLKQTFTDLEVIIVDDGSSEDIKGALQTYLDEHDNVHYVRQENKGPGPARNTGIRQAKGKWIAFLDGDDLWLADKIEKQMEYLEKHPDTLMLGALQIFNHRSGKPVLMDRVRRFENFDTRKETLTYYLTLQYTSATSTFVMSRKMLDDVGVFDESFYTDEDEDLLFRMIRKYPCYSIADVVVLRRKHDSNMTGDALEPRIKNKYLVTKKILSMVDASDLTESKANILGHWTEQFARRHRYWKQYGYAAKWLITGIVFYPQYYFKRFTGKLKKILSGNKPDRNVV